MRRFASACRVVFNEELALQKERYAQGENELGDAGLCKQFTAWRQGAPSPSGRVAPWLAEATVHALQQALKALERAHAKFFAKRADFPRLKRKACHKVPA
jgi:putative transposase